MRKSVAISLLLTFTFIMFSYFIAKSWISEVEIILGPVLTWLFMVGVVFLPCYGTFYIASSLLWKVKQSTPVKEDITVLVAAYNEEDSIKETIDSINNSKFLGSINIIVVNDGSVDGTKNILQKLSKKLNNLLVINKKNGGKSSALNEGLKWVKTDRVVTIDGDTILHINALQEIISRHISKGFQVTAGAIRVNNPNKNLITKIQNWDYMVGLASAKQAQGSHDGILVAQGAFSCFDVSVLREIGGWREDVIGEDIVLSWHLNKMGMLVGYTPFAVCFTNTPESYKSFFHQRKRWSRGLIEAFKQHSGILFKPHRNLPFYWYNVFFPFIDLAFTFGLLPALISAIFFKYYLLAGVMTILLIPLGLCLMLLIYFKQKQVNQYLNLSWNSGGIISFIIFILFFQIIQTPATLSGYFSEIVNTRKKW